MIELKELIARGLQISSDRISEDLRYNSIPEWDSTGHMALIAEIEESYDLMLDTDDIIEMSSVSRIREILKNYDVHS